MKLADQILEGLGWGLLAATTRTVVRYGLKAQAEAADAAGVAVPVLSALVAGRSLVTASIGSAAGVGAAELVDRVAVKATRIVFWSDSHGATEPRLEIIRRMALEPAVDLYVFGGDAEGWDRWYSETEPLRRKARVIPLPGNHDEPPAKAIGGVELPSVVSFSDAELLFLPDEITGAAQKKALELLAATKKHVLAFGHRSPIAFSRENASGVIRTATALAPILERGIAYFCGHHHVYGWGTFGPSSVVSAGIAGSKHYDCVCEPPRCVECDPDVRGYIRIDVKDRVAATLVPVAVDHDRT